MESNLDRGVMTILKGIDLDKYLEHFQKHKINLELFSSLDEEDLRNIGIEEKSDIQLLIKYIKRTRKAFKQHCVKPYEFEDVSQILTNTEIYLHSVNVACDFIKKNVLQKEPKDEIVYDDESASSLIIKLSGRIEEEHDALCEDVKQLMKEIEGNDEVECSTNRTMIKYTVGTLLISFILGCFSFYKKKMCS